VRDAAAGSLNSSGLTLCSWPSVAYMPHPATHTRERDLALSRRLSIVLRRFNAVLYTSRSAPTTKDRTYCQPMICIFGATVCKTLRPVLWDRCLSVCNVGVLWPNGWMDQDAAWYGSRPRLTRHCVRWVLSFPHGKGHSTARHFSALVYCGETVAHLSNCLALVCHL